MKYILSILSCFLPSLAVLAGNGDDHLGISSGFLFSNTGNVQFNYERETNYGNAYELFGEMGAKFLPSTTPQDYYWGGGIGYKWGVKRFKNSTLRITSEVHSGAHIKNFYFGFGAGLEYAYVFPSGVQFVVQQKNQVNFLNNGTFKHGLLIGLKFPL